MHSVWHKPLKKSKWPGADSEVLDAPFVPPVRRRPKRPWPDEVQPAETSFVWRRMNPRGSASGGKKAFFESLSLVSGIVSAESHGAGATGSVLQREAAESKRGVQGPHRVTRRSAESCGPPVTVASKEAMALASLSDWWAASTLDACKAQ